MEIKGAGGTSGGTGSFILGFLMMCAGGYMLLNSIVVVQPFGFGMGLFSFALFGGPFMVTTGMVLIPLIFGIGIIFYNAKNLLGWALALGSLAALIIGVIANLQLGMRRMSLFELLIILVLTVGGLGLFLKSLRSSSKREKAGNE
jgi:uncharacterized protein